MEVLAQESPPLLGLDLPWFHHLVIQESKKRLKKEKKWIKRNKQKMDCQPEPEAMQKEPEPTCQVQAVQTRSQAQRDRDEAEKDDEASAESGATPVELNTLDDSLFTTPKMKKVQTRAEKRAQARKRIQQPPRTKERHLLELSKDEVEEEQHADLTLGELWNLAEHGENNFTIEKGLLKHHSRDEWGRPQSNCCTNPFPEGAYQAGSWVSPRSSLRIKEDNHKDPEKLLLEGPQQEGPTVLQVV